MFFITQFTKIYGPDAQVHLFIAEYLLLKNHGIFIVLLLT